MSDPQSAEPDNDTWKKVCDFLGQPTAFPDGTVSVKRVTTHASEIFIGSTTVYKIKRPVSYPYMDFSRLADRHENCLKELSLNKKTAPTLYLDVTPITKDEDGTLHINGAGKIVEWAVKMARFPEEDLLFYQVRGGKFDRQNATQLAETLARFHLSLEKLDRSSADDDIESILKGLRSGFDALASNPLVTETNEFLATAQSDLDQLKPILKKRGQKGFIRRCHGDLHLKNIVQLKGELTPFDALEFNDTIAEIDVLYDLSFLLMDLLHEGERALAGHLFNRYAVSGHEFLTCDGVRLIPFFMSLRAGIRAMVSLELDEDEPEPARSYLALAKSLRHKSQPTLIIIGGLSGTGKSTLASNLASHIQAPLGAALIRSDLERKHLFEKGETETLDDDFYQPAMSAMVYNLMFEKARLFLKAGQPVILDAVFLRDDERAKAQSLASDLNLSSITLLLKAEPEILFARVRARANDASDADVRIVKKQLALIETIKGKTHSAGKRHPVLSKLGRGQHPQKNGAHHNLLWVDASHSPEETLKASLIALTAAGCCLERQP